MDFQVGTRLTDQLAHFLDLAAGEAKLTAANMANIDTPGYRALGMDFEAEIQRALSAGDAGQAAPEIRIRAEEGLISRPDGNNVSMDRESLNLAEAQLKFKTGVVLLRTEYQRVLDAIHADTK